MGTPVNAEFHAAAVQMLRAYARRVGDDPGGIHELGQLASLPQEADDQLHTAVGHLRRAGYSWTEIGRELGVGRTAAQKRFRLAERQAG